MQGAKAPTLQRTKIQSEWRCQAEGGDGEDGDEEVDLIHLPLKFHLIFFLRHLSSSLKFSILCFIPKSHSNKFHRLLQAVTLPDVNLDDIHDDTKKLLRWDSHLQNYWEASPYFLEDKTSKSNHSLIIFLFIYYFAVF